MDGEIDPSNTLLRYGNKGEPPSKVAQLRSNKRWDEGAG